MCDRRCVQSSWLLAVGLVTSCASSSIESTPVTNEGNGSNGSLTIRVTRASYGTVSAQTVPRATCTASARLPSGRQSTAQGLDTHDADGAGNITWTYRTVSSTTSGTGTYTLTCSSAGQTKTVTTSFTVR